MRLRLLRPDDLLALEFELLNLVPSADGTRLEREDAAKDAVVIVHLPPQALAEEVFDDPVGIPNPPLRSVLSGPSRLAFRLPSGSLPLSPEGLLEWSSWEPILSPKALPRDASPESSLAATELEPTHTTIEFPYRLLISPDEHGRWCVPSPPEATTHGQLWSVLLHSGSSNACESGSSSAEGADVRALAQRGGPVPDPLTGSLDPSERDEIVRLSSDFELPVGHPPSHDRFTPVPIRAEKLELTTLGANADLDGQWEYPEFSPPFPPGYVPINLRKYRHVAALGRDHFVRTVSVGFLCGTGHRAAVIKTVERLPAGTQVVGQTEGGALFGARANLLRMHQVVVQQPLLEYGPELAPAFAYAGRELPFRSIRLTTLSARFAAPGSVDQPFWLMRPEGGYLQFGAIGVDADGAPTTFTLPLMFVPFASLDQHRTIRAVFEEGIREMTLSGQPLAVAPSQGKPGATTVTARRMRYDIEQPHWRGGPSEHLMNAEAAPDWYLPRFLPRVTTITASSPAVDDLLGTATTQELILHEDYLKHGFEPGANRAELFLELAQKLPLGFTTQRGGGLASPSQTVAALSRGLGPVASPAALQGGAIDLAAFDDMRIFGTVRLAEILQDTPFDRDAAAGPLPPDTQLDDFGFTLSPPRIVTTRSPLGAPVPDRVASRLLWKPKLKSKELGLLQLDLDPARTDFLLDVRAVVERGGQTTSTVRGRLRGAKLVFAKALSVTIGELTFRQESGKKPEFGAAKVDVAFDGPLAFVNALQSILPEEGFDDPPFVTVDPQGVIAGYTLGVPDVAVGIFSLQNLNVSAALSLPFTDRPTGMRFAISERHKPFLVTVSLFGGGGFFAVGVSAEGLEEVEASLEFGGNFALNLGVASGGVSVMAGIYFGLKGPVVTLTGYLRCGGYLEVLGLISVSVEFYLAFTYRKKPVGSEVWGQARLTVCVKVAFFSTSVSLSVERRFAGSDGDPPFSDNVSPEQWGRYLQAFA